MNERFRIVPLARGRTGRCAQLLYAAFRETSPLSWPTPAAARREVRRAARKKKILLVALKADGEVAGWIGAQPVEDYAGGVWELHPLVVDEACRGRGIGSALVSELERRILLRGGRTLWLGTDDENGRTSVSNVELYPRPLRRLSAIRNPGRHPYEFYLKAGFALVGILPDANGPGKPDIFMAKRLESG
jgi:aminoglycoside 6'-N-acetyltransferase I